MVSREITIRDALGLLLEAGSYPRQGNADWRTAADMEVAAREKIEGAIGSSGRPGRITGVA